MIIIMATIILRIIIIMKVHLNNDSEWRKAYTSHSHPLNL
jgi:hypothetical protein